MTKKIQVLFLNTAEIDALNELAQITNSLSPRGTRKGEPSWRVLVERIANGEIKIQIPLNEEPGHED